MALFSFLQLERIQIAKCQMPLPGYHGKRLFGQRSDSL